MGCYWANGMLVDIWVCVHPITARCGTQVRCKGYSGLVRGRCCSGRWGWGIKWWFLYMLLSMPCTSTLGRRPLLIKTLKTLVSLLSAAMRMRMGLKDGWLIFWICAQYLWSDLLHAKGWCGGLSIDSWLFM